MVRNLLACFIILLGSSFCLGQSEIQDKKGQGEIQGKNQYARYKATERLREMSGRIKEMDEPELRIFLRHRIASYLWLKNFKAEFTFAEMMVESALEDIHNNKKKMSDGNVNYYQSKFLALLRSYSPTLANTLIDKYELGKNDENSFNVAHSMLNADKHIPSAVELVSRSLNEGKDGGLTLLLFLTNLEKQKHPDYLKLMAEILAVEELKPGTFSTNSLYMLKSLYLKNEMPIALRRRFLAVVLGNAERSVAASGTENTVISYHLMGDIYREIEKLYTENQADNLVLPLYVRARNVMVELKLRVPNQVIQQTATQDRIEKSDDPLRQLQIEANASSNESDKRSLTLRAARLALEKGDLKTAIELFHKISFDDQTIARRDEFLEEIIDAAIKKKDEVSAQYVISLMKVPSNKASSMQKLALVFLEAKEPNRAVIWMIEVAKSIEAIEDDAVKVRKLFEIIPVYKKIDETKVFESALTALKFLEKMQKSRANEKNDSSTRKTYVESLTNIVWHAIPAFRILTKQDENWAASIASGIARPEIKAAAFWGLTMELLETSKNQDVPAKTKQ